MDSSLGCLFVRMKDSYSQSNNRSTCLATRNITLDVVIDIKINSFVTNIEMMIWNYCRHGSYGMKERGWK